MLLEIGRVRRDERVVLAECDRSFVDNHGCGKRLFTASFTAAFSSKANVTRTPIWLLHASAMPSFLLLLPQS